MYGLFKCVCTSFRWVEVPLRTAAVMPICHGVMLPTGVWIKEEGEK